MGGPATADGFLLLRVRVGFASVGTPIWWGWSPATGRIRRLAAQRHACCACHARRRERHGVARGVPGAGRAGAARAAAAAPPGRAHASHPAGARLATGAALPKARWPKGSILNGPPDGRRHSDCQPAGVWWQRGQAGGEDAAQQRHTLAHERSEGWRRAARHGRRARPRVEVVSPQRPLALRPLFAGAHLRRAPRAALNRRARARRGGVRLLGLRAGLRARGGGGQRARAGLHAADGGLLRPRGAGAGRVGRYWRSRLAASRARSARGDPWRKGEDFAPLPSLRKFGGALRSTAGRAPLQPNQRCCAAALPVRARLVRPFR